MAERYTIVFRLVTVGDDGNVVKLERSHILDLAVESQRAADAIMVDAYTEAERCVQIAGIKHKVTPRRWNEERHLHDETQ